MNNLNNLIPLFQGFLIIAGLIMLTWLFGLYKGMKVRGFALRQFSSSLSERKQAKETEQISEPKQIERNIGDEITKIAQLMKYEELVDWEKSKNFEVELLSAWVLKEHFVVPREEIIQAVSNIGTVPQEAVIAEVRVRVSALNLLDRLIIPEVYRTELKKVAYIARKKIAVVS